MPVALDAPVEPFGRALRVPLPGGLPAGARSRVRVAWATTPASSSLQWLSPVQTSGPHPYVMSQNQAIHARAMFPCQDAPGVKFTYTARVTAPAPLTALMSAARTGDAPAPPGGGGAPARVFSFAQAVPVPSYLVSLAVGLLDSRAVGPRTRVWAEPAVLDAAAAEFAGCLERFVAAGEALVGPYVWGTYEVLVCPKSFAYGGMEHPVVTNVTPTLLAGDQSLVDVVAHEAAHSWTGNSVGCATWESFFLNEGFTMMLERKICAAVGAPGDYDFSALSGAYALAESVRGFTERGEERYTALVPDLAGVDPDDAFSAVPYERGFALLHAIQKRVGVPAFDAFLHDWVQTFKFKAVTAEAFRAYANAYFSEGRFALPRVAHAGRPVHSGARGAPSPEDIRALAEEPVVAVPPETGNRIELPRLEVGGAAAAAAAPAKGGKPAAKPGAKK